MQQLEEEHQQLHHKLSRQHNQRQQHQDSNSLQEDRRKVVKQLEAVHLSQRLLSSH
jgi:hypothetical protein